MPRHHIVAPSTEGLQRLRVEAGRWLKGLREDAGLSQRQLANAVGFDYYTFISQLESGRGRVPQGQYLALAKALNVPLKSFVKTLTRYYDPITYYALFEADGEEDSTGAQGGDVDVVEELSERIAKLEKFVRESKG